ncbi:MAG: ergothioneine biosynthesis protein EgtB [Pseudomonadota bacterium]
MPYDPPARADALLERFQEVRGNSERLAAPLSDEDQMVQSMVEASPTKWNLAHTSWFFETFLLQPYFDAYEACHPAFSVLFNSYYRQVGERHPRGERGMLSRPSGDEVRAYRAHVNAGMQRFLETADHKTVETVTPLVALGLAHEEQHQELLLTDIKHGLYQNPLMPGPYDGPAPCAACGSKPTTGWVRFGGGMGRLGHDGGGFSFDNEGPAHDVYIGAFELARRPVTVAEYIAFIEDGGYRDSALWLSDGWDAAQSGRWDAPLYWRKDGAQWLEYTLFGERPLNPNAPVCHVSHYEADAYAAWTGYRLPTESEWERAAAGLPVEGGFLKNATPDAPRPAPDDEGLLQMFGDVWEWTQSPYTPYPGYRASKDAIGEYNGKFMSNQMVLRGGSCATPEGHIRRTYRNFFQPWTRWQFSGLRLARDV